MAIKNPTKAIEFRRCLACGKVFSNKGVSAATWKTMKACSLKCRGILSRKSPEESFWEKTDKHGPDHPTLGKCWVWTGGKVKGGYGQLHLAQASMTAHRYSWLLHYGSIDADLSVLHRCDNPACVNPGHLFQGTHAHNAADRHQKGRDGDHRGTRNGRAKLTDEIIRKIRRRYRPKSRTDGAEAMAREFGVCSAVIRLAIHGGSWQHVQD